MRKCATCLYIYILPNLDFAPTTRANMISDDDADRIVVLAKLLAPVPILACYHAHYRRVSRADTESASYLLNHGDFYRCALASNLKVENRLSEIALFHN